MKCAAAVALLALSSLFAYGKDLIILKSGEKVVCRIKNQDSLNFYISSVRHNRRSIIIPLSKDRVDTYQKNYKGKDENPNSTFFEDAILLETQKRRKIDSLEELADSKYKTGITIGIFNGGSLFGVDIEKLVFKNIGLQAGMGYIGYDLGIIVHTKNSINSPCICLQYWHFGDLNNYYIELLAASFCFRKRGGFSCQIGIGYLYSTFFKLNLYRDNKNISQPDAENLVPAIPAARFGIAGADWRAATNI